MISFHLLLNAKEEKTIENSIKFKRNSDNFQEKYSIIFNNQMCVKSKKSV